MATVGRAAAEPGGERPGGAIDHGTGPGRTNRTTPPGNRRGRETRRRILDAAMVCFEERGLDLTLDEVARAADTTRMTVHRHVGGREVLITSLVLRASAQLADRLREVLDGPRPFPERLADALVLIVTDIRELPHLSSLFTSTDLDGRWTAVDPDDRVMSAVREFFRPYLVQADAAGLLRHPADATLGWLLNQVLLILVVPGTAPDAAAAREVVERFVVPSVLAPT